MLYFGVEIEFVVSPGGAYKLQKAMEGMLDLVIMNDYEEGYPFFREVSVTPYGVFDYGMEIKTQRLEYTPDNIERVRVLLNTIMQHAIPNDSCAVHVHMSKPGYEILDHYALLYKYLSLGYARKLLVINGLRMEDRNYASYIYCKNKYQYQVNSCKRLGGKYIIDEQLNEKKSLYKVHHLNTIEYSVQMMILIS